jgi:mannose/cellobiose epimerase-like protein (N-acyl-D-glucosamine 2-epimerase family)
MTDVAEKCRAHTPTRSAATDIRLVARRAEQWLFRDVLPLWASAGHDDAHGGFFEQIDIDTGAPIALPKRCRVQARQAYAFIEAGRLGWRGRWEEKAESGVAFMLAHHLRADGLMRFKTRVDGAPNDESVDNYDQAFAIFALAHAHSIGSSAPCQKAALDLLAALRRKRAHPLGGFVEGSDECAPLLSNPHMHLFEAALAWLDIAPQEQWRALAEEIARLGLQYFIDPATLILHEYFEHDWSPRSDDLGSIVEPGHQFEWAWLLWRWRAHGGDVDRSAIRGLYESADRNGVDRARSLTVAEVWSNGRVKDAGARLWAQTERIKAALVMARLWPQERVRHENAAIDAWRGLQGFIAPTNPGLFRDKISADGVFVPEGALASSLYHIVGAVSELIRYSADRSAK